MRVAVISNMAPPRDIAELNAVIDAFLAAALSFLSEGETTFLFDGGRGMATGAALALLLLRPLRSGVGIELSLPCGGREKGWARRDRERLCELMKSADAVSIAEGGYKNGCVTGNECEMVRRADAAIFMLKTGSRRRSRELAESLGKRILYI